MKIPGLYKKIPKFFYSMTNKMFGSAAGFKTENMHVNKDMVSFDMIACPYLNNCTKYGCPEITEVFCEADDICYGNMHPKLIWGRTTTLAKGGKCCDFKLWIEDTGIRSK